MNKLLGEMIVRSLLHLSSYISKGLDRQNATNIYYFSWEISCIVLLFLLRKVLTRSDFCGPFCIPELCADGNFPTVLKICAIV